MVNLTIYRKDRKDFIVGVDKISDPNFYIIKYANNKTKNLFKSEKNRKILLQQLEEQFLTMKENYKYFAKDLKKANVILSIVSFLAVGMIAFSIDYNLSGDIINSLFTNIMLMLYNVYITIQSLLVSSLIDEKQKRIALIEEFLVNREELEKLRQNSEEKELTYCPVDLMNIDNFNSLDEIKDFINDKKNVLKLGKILD